MRNRISLCLLALCLLSCLSACRSSTPTAESTAATTTAATTAPDSYQEIYHTLLVDYQNILAFRFSDSFAERWNEDYLFERSDTLDQAIPETGDLAYRWSNMIVELPVPEAGEAEADFGYCLYDLNSDDMPELFWVRKDHSIVAIFTVYNGQALLLDAFWSRYQGYLTEDGMLYCRGSSGAADNSCRLYALPSGGFLQPVYGFSIETDPADGSIRYYEYSNGTDRAITRERFLELSDAYPYAHSQFWLSVPIQTVQ